MSINDYICKFKANFLHILNDAKILPCNQTACTACILNTIDQKGFLKCTLCKTSHFIIKID